MSRSTLFESRCDNFMLCPFQSLNTYRVTESSPPQTCSVSSFKEYLGHSWTFGLLNYIVTTLNSESKWERTVGWAWPTSLTKWLRNEGHFPKGGISIKQERDTQLLVTQKLLAGLKSIFLWTQVFFFLFFSQISSLHHVQLLFAYSWLKYYIYFH